MIVSRVHALAVLVVLAWPLAVAAQAPGKPAHVAFIEAGSRSANQHFADAFRRGLRDLGYVEGQTLVIEERWADGQPERFPELIADVAKIQKVDVIVVASTPGAAAAKAAVSTVPVVFWGVSDPVGIGLVTSLRHPGHNLTGLSLGTEDGLAGKWLELLKQAVPSLGDVAILKNPDAKGLQSRVAELKSAAGGLKLTLQFFDARSAGEIESAFAAMARARPSGLVVVVDPLTLRHRDDVVRLAAHHHLPAVYGFGEFVVTGGLLAYGPSVKDQAYRAASFVDRILKGARPADLPVERPTTFELIINVKTAKALGLTMPPALLLRADRILE